MKLRTACLWLLAAALQGALWAQEGVPAAGPQATAHDTSITLEAPAADGNALARRTGPAEATAQQVAPTPPAFVIVVHSQNPLKSLPRKQVANMFLKKVRVWERSDLAVEPVDRSVGAKVRSAFTLDILIKKRVSSVKEYWNRMIFSGKGAPPDELDSDRAVMAFIRDRPGAIGYVSGATKLGPGVKVLEVTER